MTESQVWMLTVAAVVVVLFLGLVLGIVFNNAQEKKKRALAVISGQSPEQKTESREKTMARQRAELARKLKEASDKEKEKKAITLSDLIHQAGLNVSVKTYWISSAILGALSAMVILSTGLAMPVKLCLIVAMALGFPRLVLRIKAKRRQKKFLEEFADALEAIVRLLQAGMPVSEAIAMVGREYEGPVGEEMMQVYEDQKVGIPIGEAAERAARRMPLTEVEMFATAIQIQSETGSSLSEVLTNLASVIRARFRLKRKVHALSSEAKASAGIIGALPVLVSLGLWAVNPDYISLLFTTDTGKKLIYGAMAWMSVGIFIMKQMINFKV